MTMLETVAQLLDRSARVEWQCEVGKALGHVSSHCAPVNLARLVADGHGDQVLGNRRPPCPVPGCPGRVMFRDLSTNWPRPLDTITDRDAAFWSYEEARRVDLKARGWVVKSGYWAPPAGTRPGL